MNAYKTIWIVLLVLSNVFLSFSIIWISLRVLQKKKFGVCWVKFMDPKRCNYMIAWNLTKLPFIELPMWFIMNLSLERIQWRSSLSINPMLWCFMNKFMWSAWHPSSAMLEDHLDYSLAFLFWLRVFNALTNRSQEYFSLIFHKLIRNYRCSKIWLLDFQFQDT